MCYHMPQDLILIQATLCHQQFHLLIAMLDNVSISPTRPHSFEEKKKLDDNSICFILDYNIVLVLIGSINWFW